MPEKKHKKKISRNIDYFKPEPFKDYTTVAETAKAVGIHPSWLVKLEKEERIPKASRVERGSVLVRLWSPAQVKEIKAIISKHRPGRPRKA